MAEEKKTPIIIKHRVNKISELDSVHQEWGVEIDLRSDVAANGKLHLSHDPWVRGDDFETWIDAFAARRIQGPLILNTKEDGLETRARHIAESRGVHRFFFLDTALPTLVRWGLAQNERRLCVRFSAYEPLAATAAFRGKVDWVWVDCFDTKPASLSDVKTLKKDFRICLVSPELQGAPLEAISAFKPLGEIADAICTKAPERWQTS